LLTHMIAHVTGLKVNAKRCHLLTKIYYVFHFFYSLDW
jgi:hypothetical protein